MPFIGPKPADTVLDSTLIADGTITSAKIANDAVTSAKVAAGTIVDSDIGNVAATKLTGTVVDARISASSVQQHVTSFDDNKLVNDISTLALRQASNENKTAYNSNSMSIDVFQDATGITNLTGVTRNASEYIDSTATTVTTPTRSQDADQTGTDGDYSWFRWTDPSGTGSYSANTNETAEILIIAGGGGGGTGGGEGGGGGAGGLIYYGSETPKTPTGSAITLTSGQTYTATIGAGGTGATSYGTNGGNGTSGGNSSFTGSGLSLTTALGGGTGGTYPDNGAGHGNGVAGGSGGGGGGNSSGGGSQTGGAGTSGQGFAGGNGYYTSSGGNRYLGAGGGGASAAGQTPSGSQMTSGNGGNGLSYSITGSSVAYAGGGAGWYSGSGTSGGTGGTGGGGTATPNKSHGTDGLGGGGSGGGGQDGGNGTIILRVPTQISTQSMTATGSFEGNAITAPTSTSKMGAIITYQNQAGTNTLNTDVVLKLSADGGTNYSTATLTALPDFATGIKMAKVNDLAVTAGTSLKYKLEFANQASGSKEARIRGVSLQY